MTLLQSAFFKSTLTLSERLVDTHVLCFFSFKQLEYINIIFQNSNSKWHCWHDSTILPNIRMYKNTE